MISRPVFPILSMLAALVIGASLQEVQAMKSDAGLQVRVVDPLVKVLPNTEVSAQHAGSVKVEMVRNEYESAQLVITTSTDIDNLTVSVSDLEGASRVVPRAEARFLGFVPVKGGTPDTPEEHLVAKPPADIPDPILESRAIGVKAGRNQPVWLTIYAPKRCKPGTYVGNVRVASESGAISVPLEVTVHPVTLPDDRTLFLTNWFSTGNVAGGHGLQKWTEPYWKMLEAYARVMAEHRQNVIITPIMELIKGRDDGKGNLTFDFSLFDRWVELFKKAGVIGYIEGGHLGGRSEWEAKDFNASWPEIIGPDGKVKPNPSVTVTSDEERHFLSQFLPALQKHLDEKGWTDVYFQHLCDEPIPPNAESYKKLSAMVREFAPKLRIIDASMCTEIAGALDIWVPQPPEYEAKQTFFEERKKAGDDVWFYTCLSPKGKYMNRFIDYPLIETRLLHWMNFKYDLSGYLHWGFNYWQGDPFTVLEPGWGGGTYLPPGDSHIVYPGKRGPMSSIRLEALRDGVEDYELLRLLAKKDESKAREICDSVVRTMTDYTLEPSEFRKARMRLIKALEQQ